MPNGNPDFNVKELERFFSALAAVLEGFAQRHNLRLEKYYHRSTTTKRLRGISCSGTHRAVSARLRYSALVKRLSP